MLFYYYGKTILDQGQKEYMQDPIERKETFWITLSKRYQVRYPYGSAADYEFLEIPLAELNFFGEWAEILIQNSFLLHAYKNYGHILLGKKVDEETYFVVVPGNSYYREKMVASLFGFSWNVSCNTCEKEGAFGYYFQEIQLKKR